METLFSCKIDTHQVFLELAGRFQRKYRFLNFSQIDLSVCMQMRYNHLVHRNHLYMCWRKFHKSFLFLHLLQYLLELQYSYSDIHHLKSKIGWEWRKIQDECSLQNKDIMNLESLWFNSLPLSCWHVLWQSNKVLKLFPFGSHPPQKKRSQRFETGL